MTKTMGLMALGLSMALLSGCGSSDDIIDDVVEDIVDDVVDTIDPDTLLNTPAVVEKNIVGEWLTACIDTENGGSEIDRAIFANDGTGQYKGGEFSAPGCNDADGIDSWEGTFTYTIGEATSGSAGEDAVELDIVLVDEGNAGYYAMAHFITVDSFNMSADDEENGLIGDTPETRSNVFRSGWEYTRQ